MSNNLVPEQSQRELFSFVDIENDIKKYWLEHAIESKLKERCSNGKKFYFLDGPPYTAGRIHMGTAWNKLLKDAFIRYKRMNNFNVYTRPGFDMHGLPIEKATEKKLNISGRDQIEQLGVDKFIEECRALSLDNLKEMTATFKELGVWMDWDTPYMTISKEFMEGVWWLIKRIHELGRLYEGEKTLMWDAVNGTALAKHETYHANMYSTAVYIALPLVTNVPEQFVGASLVVWTTSSWTLPFTQAVLVNPDVMYALVEASINENTNKYIIAKEQIDELFLHKINVNGYRVITTMSGKELKGLQFELPDFGNTSETTGPVLLATEVNSSYGSGLVPCAPSCGADDWVVAKLNNIPARFNGLDEFGVVRNYPAFEGMKARVDDARIIDKFHEKKLVLYSHKIEHSHLFGERSKQPIIFRPTKQWFFRVEDIKSDLVNEHNTINWVPESAKNAFNAWLENLRDNSVSKQRFWGTPLPIWRNVDDASDYFVVGSAEELNQLGSVGALDDLHKSKVDAVVITRVSPKDGKSHQYKRVPDVLDVWVDAGSASWNALEDATAVSKLSSEWFPIDLILEGKDQIRGWFNLLHLLSVMVNKQKSFKNCYMHGFVVDEGEDKMSKSAGNFEDPMAVYAKHGVDPLRLYLIGAAAPGMDLKFSLQHLLSESKSLHVIWNLHKYLLEMTQLNEIQLDMSLSSNLSQEEQYVLSKLNSLVNVVTERMEQFKFNCLPPLICEFAMKTLSHWFVQTNREEMSTSAGSDDDKKKALSTLAKCLLTIITLLAPVVPHLTEQIYQNLRAAFGYLPSLQAESVHLLRWPSVDQQLINRDLEDSIDTANDVITAILAARDKLAIGVKWPCGAVHVNADKDYETKFQKAIQQAKDIILHRTNVKCLDFEHVVCNYTVSIKSQSGIAKQFGKKFNLVVKQIAQSQQTIVEEIKRGSKVLDIKLPSGESVQLNVAEHLLLSALPPVDYQLVEAAHFSVFLSKTRTVALDQEGMARECIRKVQMLRKKLDLSRKHHVNLLVITDNTELKTAIEAHTKLFMERAGLSELVVAACLRDDNNEVVYEEKMQKIPFKLVLRSK